MSKRIVVALGVYAAGGGVGQPSPQTQRSAPRPAGWAVGSWSAIELRNWLKAATRLSLSPTLIIDYPIPTTLAGYLGQLSLPDRRGSNDSHSIVDTRFAGSRCRCSTSRA